MSEVMCELCETNKAGLKCLSCKVAQNMCSDCYKATHHGDNKKTHQIQVGKQPDILSSYTDVLSLMSSQFNCSDHTKKLLEYVCKQCDVPICCDCLLVGAHKGHNASSFDEACKEINSKIQEALTREKEQSTYIAATSAKINERVLKREEQYKGWLESINAEFKKIEDAISAKKKEITADLEKERIKEFAQYETMFKKILKVQEENNGCISLMQDSMKRTINPKNYKEIKVSLPKSIKDYKIDSDPYFETNKNVMLTTAGIIKHLGRVFVMEEGKAPKKKEKKIKEKEKKKDFKALPESITVIKEAELEDDHKGDSEEKEKNPIIADGAWKCEKCSQENKQGEYVCKKCHFQSKASQKKQLFQHLKVLAGQDKQKFSIPSLCPLPSFVNFVCEFCGKKNTDKITTKCSYCEKLQTKSPDKG